MDRELGTPFAKLSRTDYSWPDGYYHQQSLTGAFLFTKYASQM